MPDFSGIGFSGAADGDCCDCGECPVTTVDFEDGTAGPDAITTVSTPWEITADANKRLRLDSTSLGDFAWNIPIVEDGSVTRVRIAADVLGDVESAPAGNSGGVFLQGVGWRVDWTIEEGNLVLRYDGEGPQTVTVEPGEGEIFSGRLTLTLTARCENVTHVRGEGAGQDVSLYARFALTPTSFPASVTGGVTAPSDTADDEGGGESPFPDCCPDDENCYTGYSATGSFEDGNCGCSPSAESLTKTTDPIACSGTSLASLLTEFDPAAGYLVGDWPFAEFFGAWNNHRLIVWCGDGTLRAAWLDANNCVLEEAVLDSATCDPFGPVFEFFDPVFSCCEDTIGRALVTVAGVVGECEDPDPREWDNVAWSACGGRADPPCGPEWPGGTLDLSDCATFCPEEEEPEGGWPPGEDGFDKYRDVPSHFSLVFPEGEPEVAGFVGEWLMPHESLHDQAGQVGFSGSCFSWHAVCDETRATNGKYVHTAWEIIDGACPAFQLPSICGTKIALYYACTTAEGPGRWTLSFNLSGAVGDCSYTTYTLDEAAPPDFHSAKTLALASPPSAAGVWPASLTVEPA